jgi:hypothetical protein
MEITRLLLKLVELHTHIESLRELVYKDQFAGYEAIIKFRGSEHVRYEAPPSPEWWLTKVLSKHFLKSLNLKVIHLP